MTEQPDVHDGREGLKARFLRNVTSGPEPVSVAADGVAELQRYLHGLIGTDRFAPAMSELARIADFLLNDKASPACAAELFELAEASMKVAHVLGDSTAASYFIESEAGAAELGRPSLAALRAQHQALAPAHHWYRPITVDLELTQKCNLRCPSCAVIDEVERGYDGLTGDEAVSILKSCEGSSVFCYSIMGGEPFLRIDDLCRIISEVELDLSRIQTNAKVFSNPQRTHELLKKLDAAGLRQRNRYVLPSINISIGIQTDAGTPLRNAAYCIAGALDLFGGDITFVLNALPHDRSPPRQLVEALAEEYRRVIGDYLPWERIGRTHLMTMEYTLRAAELGVVDRRFEPIAERFSRPDADITCPNLIKDHDWSITPRFMVTADRSFYPCSCLGFAGRMGRVGDSVGPMLEAVNRDEHLRAILEGGSLRALYEKRIAEVPGLEEREVPRAAGVCKVCKALREPDRPLFEERLPVLA